VAHETKNAPAGDPETAPRTRSRATGLAVNLCLIAASLLFVLIILEIGVRVFLPQRHGLSYVASDPELGWMQEPNARYEYQRENAVPSRVSTNAYGLRTPDIPTEKEASASRLLFIGDSFVQGLAVDDEATFCRRLEALLNANADDNAYQVINGGVDGFSPVQEMLLLERFLPIYKPDLVVQVFFAGNDFTDNADPAGRRRPVGMLDTNGEFVVVPPVAEGETAASNRGGLIEKSQLAFLLRFKVFPRSPALMKIAQRFGLARYSGVRTRSIDLDAELAVVKNSIARSRAAVHDSGARYAMVLLPSPRNEAGETHDAAPPLFDEAEQLDRLAAFLGEASIPSLELAPALEAVAEGEEIYFAGIGHFTAHGHQKTAEVLEPFVRKLIAEGR